VVALACVSCIFDTEDTGSQDTSNVLACTCQWDAGTKGKYEKGTGQLFCQSPWVPTKTNFEAAKEVVVNLCIDQAKAKMPNQSYKCVCMCDPKLVAPADLAKDPTGTFCKT